MGHTGSLVKANYRGVPGPPCLDINSRVLQLFLNGCFATPFLGIGRILVFLVGRTSLGGYVLRPPQTDVIVRFRT